MNLGELYKMRRLSAWNTVSMSLILAGLVAWVLVTGVDVAPTFKYAGAAFVAFLGVSAWMWSTFHKRIREWEEEE